MNSINREIFDKYEVRKTKKQKLAFRKFMTERIEAMGYKASVERGSLGVRNLVVGDPDSAKVIFTAHYDTCPVLPVPNFITPKSIFIYIIYQLILTALFMVICGLEMYFCMGVALCALSVVGCGELEVFELLITVLMLLCYIGTLALLMFGPANKHTANDNTSGVTMLVNIMAEMDPKYRDQVAFVFFDHEELGLLGSAAFAKAHAGVVSNTLVVNFDCVSDGDHILLALRGGAKEYKGLLEDSYVPTDALQVEICTKGVFYPSDQYNFRRGIGVAALNKAPLLGTLYLSRIHTRRDTIYREENLQLLTEGSLRLIGALADGK